jgi:hypothetical protein
MNDDIEDALAALSARAERVARLPATVAVRARSDRRRRHQLAGATALSVVLLAGISGAVLTAGGPDAVQQPVLPGSSAPAVPVTGSGTAPPPTLRPDPAPGSGPSSAAPTPTFAGQGTPTGTDRPGAPGEIRVTVAPEARQPDPAPSTTGRPELPTGTG